MENASKALIIAGAILIAIVLITLGVVILQQGDKTTGTGETALNSREIESFNSQFQKYEGESVSGTNVRALINAVNSSNAAQKNNGGDHKIQLATTTTISSVKPEAKYMVVATDENEDGYIDKIDIKLKSTTP
ncbi:MAG: hypothetical protein J6I85_01520 [Clostridia bacterium]|nr:hypothetical protein [Clostridia bacterium]